MVVSIKSENSYRSDHSPIVLTCKTNEFIKGKGFWKFNTSLLLDKDYIELTKQVIKNVKKQYACLVYNTENLCNVDTNMIQFTINDQTFLDILLAEINGKSISYSTFKKKKMLEKEIELEKGILELEKNLTEQNSEEWTNKHKEIEEIRKKKLKGHCIRAKVKWIDEGEKPSKYFLTLESRNYINKQIPQLVRNDGITIYDQFEILNETKCYYENLYRKREQYLDINDIIEQLSVSDFPKLDEKKSEFLEGPLTENEVFAFLKKMKNDKSPGPDGFTCEFFKFFWYELGTFITSAINYSKEVMHFSEPNKLGIITCIPKGKKPKEYLKNWRPICLLNVVYKIASGCIAERLKTYMDKLISRDQTGFLKGRFIGENIRLVYDLMNYTEQKHIPGLLMLIDFEKAFDSISWEFILNTLKLFNFGNSILNWIKTFYNDIKTCIIQNGIISEYFYPQRGCRQGDPISPYLFLLCAEILGNLIRNNKNIKGIIIEGVEYKISQYADDTSLFLDGSPATMDGILQELDFFANISGLKINFSKTKMIWIGSKKFSKEVFHHSRWKLDWQSTKFELLGVNFSLNLDEMLDLNYNTRLIDIKNTLCQWRRRMLTPIGRLTVIKTLIIPKMNHLILTLPNPDIDFLKNFETEIYQYLWDGKIHKVKKNIIIQEYRFGGLKMIDYFEFITALKSSWIR